MKGPVVSRGIMPPALCPLERQHKIKSTSYPFFTLHPHPATMQSNNLASDIQAKPQALNSGLLIILYPVETVKNVGLFLLTDTRTLISHPDHHLIRLTTLTSRMALYSD